jgi:phosphate transport system protein
MGDLAAHIADTARFAHPDHVVPPEFGEGIFTELGEIAAGMADRVGELIAGGAGVRVSRVGRDRPGRYHQ